MNIEYYGEDGRIKSLGDDELKHFKYLKKIKVGSGYRYFYTPEEIKAYYQTSKAMTNAKYDITEGVRKTQSEMAISKANSDFNKKNNADMRKLAEKYMNQNVYSDADVAAAEREAKEIIAKNSVEYGKKIAKEKAKNKALEAKNKPKRTIEPILNTAKAVIKGKPKKVENGKKKVEKQQNRPISRKTVKESINGKTTYHDKNLEKKTNKKISEYEAKKKRKKAILKKLGITDGKSHAKMTSSKETTKRP